MKSDAEGGITEVTAPGSAYRLMRGDGKAHSCFSGDVADGSVFPVTVSADMSVLLLVAIQQCFIGRQAGNNEAHSCTYFFSSFVEVTAHRGAGDAGMVVVADGDIVESSGADAVTAGMTRLIATASPT